MIERYLLSTLAGRIETEPRRFIQVVYGPRQVGKTTLVGQFTRKTAMPFHYVAADAVALEQEAWIGQQWEVARLKLAQSGAGKAVLIIDEVQKVGNWSEQVKKEWDSDTLNGIALYVVLLGSSRLMLQQGLTESLAGRFEAMYLGHWSYTEMQEAFGYTPENYAWYGGYPGAAPLAAEPERWKQYVRDAIIETAITRDILMLTRVDKPALMRNLFEMGCRYSGRELSYTKMMGQLQDAGNTTTLAQYLNLLDTAGLLKGLQKYAAQAVRQRASSPKFQTHNTALLSALHPRQMEEVRQQPEEWGRWVESAVGMHLLNSALRHGMELFYWRDGNLEVDFVLTHRGKAIGIEVKSGAKQKASGMGAFSKQFNPFKVLLVGDTGMPWQEFLKVDPVGLF